RGAQSYRARLLASIVWGALNADNARLFPCGPCGLVVSRGGTGYNPRRFIRPVPPFGKRTLSVNKQMLKKMVLLVGSIGLGAALSASTLALTEKQQKAMEERIRPVGTACLEGDSSCGSAVAVATGPRTAEEIYKSSCHTCHDAGVGGAPKLGDQADWKARLGKGLEQV